MKANSIYGSQAAIRYDMDPSCPAGHIECGAHIECYKNHIVDTEGINMDHCVAEQHNAFICAGVVPQQPPIKLAPIWMQSAQMAANSSGGMG